MTDSFFSEIQSSLDKIESKGISASGSIDRPSFRMEPGKFDEKAAANILEDVIDRTIQRIAVDLASKLDAAMASSVWGELGDIIDTGDLRDSLQVVIEGDSVQISYDSPYANLIHYGGYIAPYGNTSIDKVYIPGRPWVEAVLTGDGPVDSIDVQEIFDKEKQ